MSHPLRIAFLVDPLTLRSKGGRHAPQLARELLGRGHLVRSFGAPPGTIPHSSADGSAETAEEASGPGILAFAPDVLVAYDALSPAAWLGARASRRSRAGLVLVEPGHSPESDRLHERVLHGIGERLWGRYVRDTASAVVALDPVARERALAEGFSEEAVSIVPEGVDVQTFRPGLTSHLVARHRVHGRMLLYVGPIETSRGLEVLVAAFAQTVGQRSDWSLALAGDGPAASRLRAMVDRLGVASGVHFLPRARREELPGLMGAATLLASPALDDHARGVQVRRAMACGLPVLASDLPRLAYYVEPERTGLLLPPGDLAAWTQGLRRAASSPEARRRWGANARQVAQARFAWPVVAQHFESVLLEARERVREAG